jgi:hypothetical protein
MTRQKTNMRVAVGFVLAVTILLAQSAAAQNTSPPRNAPAPQITDPKGCFGRERSPPDNGRAKGPDQSTENLSKKLERGEGVICPPASIDPDIAVVPPAGGRTPVIPPPGSPGGDPNVRPK